MPRLTCRFYAVGCADAISLRFDGNDGQKQNLWVDSGWEESYDLLRPELVDIAEAGESICLWIITHWDNDHIKGMTKFLEDDFIRGQKLLRNIWFNANYRIPKNSEVKEGFVGLKEGVLLRDAIQDEFGISVPVITTDTPSVDLFGARLNILSPTPEVYRKAIAKIQAYSPTGSKGWDYSETIEELSKKDSPPDRRLENRSSIAFLLEYDMHCILMLADASPVDLIPKLRSLGYSETNPLRVDFVKVSHHGSKQNTSNELLSLIDTDKFVFTADASQSHKLPNKEAIARILCHSNRDISKHIRLFFNHQNKQLESLFDIDGKDVYERLNFSVQFPAPEQNALIIQL